MNETLKYITDAVDNLMSEGERLRQTAEVLRGEAVKLMDSRDRKKVWSGAEHIPTGSAPLNITPGCLVLEGGSFRGLYSSGVLDVLMENGINLQTVIGTSAGALNGYNYIAGQIGRSAKIDLLYRHDSRFFSPLTTAKNRGVVGFNFILDEINAELPFDRERFDSPDRRFVVTATNCDTGEGIYWEKGICGNMDKAVQASASMPLVSDMVDVDGIPCLDGGCVWKIPYQWALDNGYEKILVVRTRPSWFRREDESLAMREITERIYAGRPGLRDRLLNQKETYNTECDELDRLVQEGRVMQLFPSGSIEVSVLEGDMEKLGALYLLGRRDTELMLPQIREYLGI